MPVREENTGIFEKGPTRWAGWPIAFGEGNELSDEMRPADLTPLHRPEIERLGAVADQNTFELAEERSEGFFLPVDDDLDLSAVTTSATRFAR